MSAILRNARLAPGSVKVESRGGVPHAPELEKRYSLVDVRRLVSEAEIHARLALEGELEEAARRLEARLNEATSALVESERALRQERVRVYEQAAPEILELVMAIARRVVRRELETPGSVQPLLEELLQQIGHGQHAVVRLAPVDLHLFRERKALPESDLRGVRFVADENIAIGGCVVETERGSWDARIETQLERIAETLANTAAEWADEEAA